MTVKGNLLPAGAVSLEFKADGGLVYNVPFQTLTGTYSLGSGDSVTLKMYKELAGMKNHTETISINGNTLTMTDTDGTQIIFSKVP